MAYFDQNRATQAKAKAEQKHNVTLNMEACLAIVTESIKKSSAARKNQGKINFSEIYNQSINSTFFGNPITPQLFSVYRSFLGFYFASFKIRKLKPKKSAVRPVMLKQADLFS